MKGSRKESREWTTAGSVKGRFIEILKQSEAGAKTSDLWRQHGITAATFNKLAQQVWRDGRERR